jgi:hypothetical protein
MPEGEPDRAPREPPFDDASAVEQDPAGDPDQPVETVVRYETAAERRERLHEERRHRRHRRVTEAGVALAALFVSLAVFLVNGALFIRGSEIAVLEPDEIVFYRDAGPNGASLWFAMQTQMINAAAGDYGDVVVNASAAIGPEKGERGRFPYMGLVEPIMTLHAEKAAEDCPEAARCIVNTGFYAIQRPRRLLDVPGGSSRSEHLAFMVEEVTCQGDPAFCASLTGFDAALDHLRSRSDPVIRMNLTFHFDGEQSVVCRLPSDGTRRAAIFDYLQEKGWAAVPCERRKERRRRRGST